MIVFKNYIKIVKGYLPMVLMYTGIFLLFAVIATSAGDSTTSFTALKPKLAIQNNDPQSTFTKDFVAYLEQQGTIIELTDATYAESDALFYRKVDAILTIPKGFGSDFQHGLAPKISSQVVPDSANAAYITMFVNQYLDACQYYLDHGFTETEMRQALQTYHRVKTEVSMLDVKQNHLVKAQNFYNFANYTILATTIMVIGLSMYTFYHSTIWRRNLVSPIPISKINRQLFLGNICMTTIVWLLYVVISIVMYGNMMLSKRGGLLILNAFLFSIVALSIGFLLGILVKNREAQSGLINVIALGSSFLCGAFVPQELLSEMVLNIAPVLPSYWFVKNNNAIVLLSDFKVSSLQPIVISMMIMMGFVILFFGLANIISKQKLKKQAFL